jgi:crotonobetainyl-CoA:carnitine CoA-transferase CaiB-like acyl-CoA transferase
LASGLRVIEVGESIAAALAGMVLADYGADVCVLEPPGGSRLRRLPAFAMWGRGKRFAPADLTSDDGRRQLAGLADGADVVIAALEPATADRLGVDGEHLTARAPRLVHCEITGFGRDHPMSGVAGYEAVVAARGGRAHEFGVLFGGERPAFPAVPVATYAASMLALQGVFAALVERERTGRGQRVSTSLLDAIGVYDMVTWVPRAPARRAPLRTRPERSRSRRRARDARRAHGPHRRADVDGVAGGVRLRPQRVGRAVCTSR